MATVMDRHHSQSLPTPRTATQKVCIGLGIVFIVAGGGGIVMPGMLGMHLSFAHNIIHFLSGGLALWCGYADNPRYATNFSLVFGIIYVLLGLAGYVFGTPGFPGVGDLAVDQNLLRAIPNVLEFGTNDHVLHVILGGGFLLSAIYWKIRNTVTTKTKRGGNRPVDNYRRSEFERRT